MGAHLTPDGKFQSDKYPTTPAGKVPLSCEDPTAQDLLWEYAQRRRPVDAEFSADLEEALRQAGYSPAVDRYRRAVTAEACAMVAEDAGAAEIAHQIRALEADLWSSTPAAPVDTDPVRR